MSRPTTPLRVALLGCGRIASAIHLPILAGMPQVCIAAIAEPDEARRRTALRLAPGAALLADFRDSFNVDRLDAVVITLPNALHAPAAIAAFERGLHVYVEKPMALSAADGRALVRAWRTADVIGMVGYNYRFLPAYQQARAMMRAECVGRVIAIRSVFSTAQRTLPDWKSRRDTGGGALLDLASHHLDMSAWLVGAQPLSISCDLRSRHTQDDVALVQADFPGDVSAQVCAILGGPEEHRFEILGELGALVVNPYASEFVEMRPASLDGIRLGQFTGATRALMSPAYWKAKLNKSSWRVSYERALHAFVDGIRRGQSPEPDITSGYETLQSIDAAVESARLKGRVALSAYP